MSKSKGETTITGLGDGDISIVVGQDFFRIKSSDSPQGEFVNIRKLLKSVLDEKEAEKERRKQAMVLEMRETEAQKLFEEEDFGVKVVDSDGWETDGDYLLKPFYYESEASSNCLKAVFVVEFYSKEYSTRVAGKHTNW